MKKVRIGFLCLLLSLLFLAGSGSTALAEKKSGDQTEKTGTETEKTGTEKKKAAAKKKADTEKKTAADEKTTVKKQKAGWVQKKDGKYYYVLSDGTVWQKTGLRTIGQYTYYILKDHSRYAGFRKIKGSWYYFRQKNGRRYETPGWSDYQKKTYYFNKDFTLATGLKKISGKWYYFDSRGVLQKNRKPFLYSGNYYRTDKNGVVSKMSSTQARASIATWKFINKYSKSSQSNRERFRRCFNRMEGYMHYRPGYIKIRELSGTDWPYKCVLKVLNNNVTGNCYGFACTIASIAKELGYEPTIIVMTCDHAVVMIDGKYYDNMGARFGASHPAHRNYKVYKKFKM